MHLNVDLAVQRRFLIRSETLLGLDRRGHGLSHFLSLLLHLGLLSLLDLSHQSLLEGVRILDHGEQIQVGGGMDLDGAVAKDLAPQTGGNRAVLDLVQRSIHGGGVDNAGLADDAAVGDSEFNIEDADGGDDSLDQRNEKEPEKQKTIQPVSLYSIAH